MSIFGGGFSAPPGSSCKLRQAQGMVGQQFTSPVRTLGAVPVPVAPPFGIAPPAPQQPAAQQPNLGVVPAQNVPSVNVRGQARPVVQTPAAAPPSPIGPASYKVMKKGEAPCPICRG